MGRLLNMGGGLVGLANALGWTAGLAKREGKGVPCLLKGSCEGAATGPGEGRGMGNGKLLRTACALDEYGGG